MKIQLELPESLHEWLQCSAKKANVEIEDLILEIMSNKVINENSLDPENLAPSEREKPHVHSRKQVE